MTRPLAVAMGLALCLAGCQSPDLDSIDALGTFDELVQHEGQNVLISGTARPPSKSVDTVYLADGGSVRMLSTLPHEVAGQQVIVAGRLAKLGIPKGHWDETLTDELIQRRRPATPLPPDYDEDPPTEFVLSNSMVLAVRGADGTWQWFADD